jgi:uncharacterized protein YcnI
MSPSSAARVLTVGAAATAILLALAAPAAAHVTANPDTAEQGSFTKVSFRVPNEQPKGDTTQVEIDLPLDHPLPSVSVRPTPGWTVSVTKSKLPKPVKTNDLEITEAVSKIVWTKGTIKPEQFEEFDVSMGPLPTDTDTLAFKAIQTYSDGKVVNWDQPQPAGAEEPEHPAPTLHLTKAGASEGHHDAAPSTRPASSPAADDDGGTSPVAWLGLVAGVLGIAVGGVALARGRRAS